MIKITKFTKNDINKSYLNWLNNKQLLKFSRHKFIRYNKKKALNYYTMMKERKNFFYKIICDKKFIGTVTAYINYKKKKSNVGILIGNTKYQGKGYAYIALKKIFTVLRENKITNLEIGCNINHLKMINICKNLNFKYYKKFKNDVFFIKNINN
jgi:hypothetical protein